MVQLDTTLGAYICQHCSGDVAVVNSCHKATMDVNTSWNAADFTLDVSNNTHPAFPSLGRKGTRSPLLDTFIIVIAITGMLGNTLVVVVVYKYKPLFQQVKSSYIINQSFIDGLTSAVIIFTQLFPADLAKKMEQLEAELFCRLWQTQFLPWGLMLSSTYNLMAISIERYLAIVYPIWHMNYFTESKTRVTIGFIWIFGVAYVGSVIIPISGMVNGACVRAVFWPSRITAVVVGILELIVSIVIPMITHGICYARILMTLRKRCPYKTRNTTPSSTDTELNSTQEQPNADIQTASDVGTDNRITLEVGAQELFATKENAGEECANNKRIQTISGSLETLGITPDSTVRFNHKSLTADNQQDARYRYTRKAERNAIKTLATVTLSFFICWLPNKIHICLYLARVTSTFGNAFQFTTILVFANCCINPFIYIAKYDAFKTGLRALFKRE